MATGPVGAAVQASGNVDVRTQGSRQRLKVELEAQVPDGIMFRVFANGVELDIMRSTRGHAELEIELEDGKMLPGGMTPTSISSVKITDVNKMTVLEAQFGSKDAPAGTPAAAQDRSRVEMAATAAGATLSAHGDAEVRTQGSQRFRVQVEANAPDGTELKVFANGIEVGTVKVRFGQAELQIEDGAPLPAGIESMAAIKTVKVTTVKGDSLLEAKF